MVAAQQQGMATHALRQSWCHELPGSLICASMNAKVQDPVFGQLKLLDELSVKEASTEGHSAAGGAFGRLEIQLQLLNLDEEDSARDDRASGRPGRAAC